MTFDEFHQHLQNNKHSLEQNIGNGVELDVHRQGGVINVRAEWPHKPEPIVNTVPYEYHQWKHMVDYPAVRVMSDLTALLKHSYRMMSGDKRPNNFPTR